MNATKARGKTNLPLPEPKNGVLVRLKATCDQCKQPCKVGGFKLEVIDGYYSFNKGKLCRHCAKKLHVL